MCVCVCTQFVMVKFLCVRQDSAERLGVQQLSFSGYLCPDSERLEEEEEEEEHLSIRTHGADGSLVTGLTLIRKTLFFIQQLTRDMVAHTHAQTLRHESHTCVPVSFSIKSICAWR